MRTAGSSGSRETAVCGVGAADIAYRLSFNQLCNLGEVGVDVAHAREVGRARARADLVQQIVAARVGVEAGHLGAGIVERPELDGARRASLLAGRLELTVLDLD